MVEVVGPGDTDGSVDQSSPFYADWQNAAQTTTWLSFTLGFVSPIVQTVFPKVDHALADSDAGTALVELATIIKTALPANTVLKSTNLKVILVQILTLLTTTASFRQAIEGWISKWIKPGSKTPGRLNAIIEQAFGRPGGPGSMIVTILDKTSGFTDVGWLVDAWSEATVYRRFTINAILPSVVFSGAGISSEPDKVTGGFTAQVTNCPFPGKLRYHWSTSGKYGSLLDKNGNPTKAYDQIVDPTGNSSSASAQYLAPSGIPTGQKETVSLDVYTTKGDFSNEGDYVGGVSYPFGSF